MTLMPYLLLKLTKTAPGKVEFNSSTKNGLVMVNFWQFYAVMVLKRVEFHSSFVNFGSSTQLWSWNAWNLPFYCLFWQFYMVFYTVMVLECLEIHISIATVLWIGSVMSNFESLWSLMGLVMVVFSLNLKGGLWWRWNVMHCVTCGLGRGSPASDSLTLSRWSSAVTSANAGPNPLHDWIDCGCCLHGLLWSTRWTLIPGSEGWSNQVFNCVGTSRTRDVCSKCAGVLWSYNFLMRWMMRFLTCLCHQSYSFGGVSSSPGCHHASMFGFFMC